MLRERPKFLGRFRLSVTPVFPVQASVLDGLGDVLGADVALVVEVGDRAGQFEDAVVGPGGQTESLHG